MQIALHHDFYKRCFMPDDRLWMFNPGGPQVACCDDESTPFPNCLDLNGQDLFLTDAHGTHPMIYKGGGSDNYYVSYQFTPTVSVSAPGGICVMGTDPVSVLYELDCFTSGGVTYAQLSIGFAINNDPCGQPPTHPYRLYQRSDTHPVADTWTSANAGQALHVPYPLSNPNALEFTFPSTGTNGPPFHDYYDYPAPGLVSITL